MERGALTQYLDVAQVCLYAFWIFFAGLIFYIRREDRREGYPLENDKTGLQAAGGFPFIPDPKTFVLGFGRGSVSVPTPDGGRDTRPIKGVRTGPGPGMPMEPTGNPLIDGIGPASYAQRADVPDLTAHGDPRIVPLRAAGHFHVNTRDPDPRGFKVVGCDGRVAGTVTDMWVDQSEYIFRYMEVSLGAGAASRRVLLPVNFTVLRPKAGEVYVHALRASQFADVPGIRHADQVTLLEEDKIMGYYGGGTLYATPMRAEPLL